MSYDYAPLAATAKRLLARFGRPVNLRSMENVAGPAWSPTLLYSDVETAAIIRPYTVQERGALIPAEDQLAILDGDAVPTVAQKLIDGLAEFEIVSVSQSKPGDTSLVYFCQVRR